MRWAKLAAGTFLGYAALVVAFESVLGIAQPGGQDTLVITTFDEGGTARDRVVARLDSHGQLFVAANHWPRAWYRRALRNPSVRVTVDGRTRDYFAVPANAEEHDRVDSEHRLGIAFRILTGFPPRYFLRLDPAPDAARLDGSRPPIHQTME